MHRETECSFEIINQMKVDGKPLMGMPIDG